MILTSKSNPFIRETAALKDKKGRRESGLFLVEGAKMVRECMRSGLETEAVILAESYAGEEFPDAVRVSDELFRRLSDEKSPQGILCRVRIPKRALCPPDGSASFWTAFPTLAIWARLSARQTRRDIAKSIWRTVPTLIPPRACAPA